MQVWESFDVCILQEDFLAHEAYWDGISLQIDLELAAIAAGYRDFDEFLDSHGA